MVATKIFTKLKKPLEKAVYIREFLKIFATY